MVAEGVRQDQRDRRADTDEQEARVHAEERRVEDLAYVMMYYNM